MPADGGTLSAKSTVQSLTKGLRVLEAFTAERSEMSLAEVARAAGIDNGTAFRFLNTLVMLGYIRKTKAKRFRLTLKCLDLGFRAIGRTELRELARPLLRDLVGPEIEAASVAVLDGAEVVYIERVQAGLARLGVDVHIGSRAPAYSTAIGQTMLAQLPRATQEALLGKGPLRRLTTTTVTSIPKLLERLVTVRRRGYALSDGENVQGLRVLAAPVLDADGAPVAAVSVATPAFASTLTAFERATRERVMTAAQTLSTAVRAGGSVAAVARGPGVNVKRKYLMPVMTNFHGLIPAMAVPFRPDHSIDEPELTRFARWLATQPGIVGMMTNGHTGEVFSLTPRERAEVTRIAAKAVDGQCPVISSIVCEGIKDAIEQAQWAKEAGAQALDIMPPHHWLRFGFRPSHVIDYFTAIGEACRLPLIVHVYPAWTKASFSSELLAELAKLSSVHAFKIGTREMNKYQRDLQMIRAAAPDKALLTCHDEYLLPSMVQGVDGALVGFASVIPGLIHDLLQAVKAGDLARAMAIQARIDPLKDAVYGGGEPTGEAHANMKAAMVAAGIFRSGTMRPPTLMPSREELRRIEAAVAAAGLGRAEAAE